MLTVALSALALTSPNANRIQESKPVALKVEQAIVYPTGLVMLTRSAPIEKGTGRYKVTIVPEAAQGSLWYGVPEGALIGDVVTRLRFEPRVETFNLNTPAQLLAANVGKKVRFALATAIGKKETLEGVIEYVKPPAENQAGLRLANGTLRTFNPFSVIELDTKGLATTVDVKTRIPERTMEIEIDAEKPSKLWILSLERGAAWAGSYAIETKEGNEATFLFKLQLALGALKFESSDVRLLAGAPRLPGTLRTDLASGAASFGALFGEKTRQVDLFNVLRDPYDEILKVLRERDRIIADATYAAYGRVFAGNYGGGGFGGGGIGGGGMDYISYDPSDNSIVNRPDFANASFRPASGAPEELLDLISYPLGRLSLEPGDRMSRVQLKATTKCEPVVRWNLGFRPEPGYTGNIGRYLRLPNNSTLFWVPGPCLVSHLGTPIALSEMPLTAPKDNAYIRVDDSESILHNRQVKEISRRIIASPNRFEITAEFTYTLGNTTSQAIEFEVAQDVEGKVLDAPDAEVKAMNPFSVPNPLNRVEWRLKLNPGETKEFKLSYVHRQM